MRRRSVTPALWIVLLLCGCGGESTGSGESMGAPMFPTNGASGPPGPSSAGDPSSPTSSGAASDTAGDTQPSAGAAGNGGETMPTTGDPGSTDPGDASDAVDTGDDAVDDVEAPVVDAMPTTGPFPEVQDFAAAGPYTSTTLANVGPGNNYAVYMPAEPAPEGVGNPLVAWTSGGGTSHAFYTLLPHLATHGFIVVTSNTIPGIGAEAQLGQEIVAGLDWAIEENGRSGSMLFERIDTTRVASAGYSMGSLATFEIADDPRLLTTVHISGGSMAPGVVENLRQPAAFICGIPDPACSNLLSGTCDIAGANCANDFDAATTPVFYATFEAGHLGILTSPFMERINAMTTAWLRRQLMGDTTLAARFEGSDCSYCSDPDWTVRQKGLD